MTHKATRIWNDLLQGYEYSYRGHEIKIAEFIPEYVDKKTGKKEFAVTAKIMGDDGIERVQLYDLSTAKRLPDLFAYDELFAKFEAK